ncbi:MAG: malto-oligosyltrehalose trehalohydrolase [Candidatus Hydrogenedentes bacterium]|nr:malto-oligosyltrehalose trehalohydrolase [Candidatus Hydrogenedentota bacterium]
MEPRWRGGPHCRFREGDVAVTEIRQFRVWAPFAERMALELDGQSHEMEAAARGYWEVRAAAPAGSRYGYRIDGRPPLPDPRSPSQPEGPFGLSAVVDHDAFQWTDQNFRACPLGAAIFYELHVGTFTEEGTFEGVIARLDHLVSLGVTHVELMPACEFPGTRGWGYDGVNLYAPHHGYGGPEGLKRLIDAAHARGLAVVHDVVYNHLGPSGNFLQQFGPYHLPEVKTLWGDALNFGGRHSDEVRRYFLDNALMWFRDYHFDGLRLDAVGWYGDASAYHLLEELADEANVLEAHLGRPLILIAESDQNDPRIVRPAEVGGYGIDAQWNDDFQHALHALLTGESMGYYEEFDSLEALARCLKEGVFHAGIYNAFRGRRHGRRFFGLNGNRLLGFLQNHDHVGNRALGERSSHLLSEERLKIAAGLVFTAPFVPLLFAGEEWAASTPFLYFTDHVDPEVAEAVRRGRRSEYPAYLSAQDFPDPQDMETFQRSRLDWAERAYGIHERMLDWHRQLVQLRRRHPVLTSGRLEDIELRHNAESQWMTIDRGPLTVAFSLAGVRHSVRLRGGSGAELLLRSSEAINVREGVLEFAGEGFAVVGAAECAYY